MGNLIEQKMVSDKNDEIVLNAWKSKSYSNMLDSGVSTACAGVKSSKGSLGNNRCRNAYSSCGSDSDCDLVALKYAKALEGGFDGSFSDFKESSTNLAENLGWGKKLLGYLSGNKDSGEQSEDNADRKEKYMDLGSKFLISFFGNLGNKGGGEEPSDRNQYQPEPSNTGLYVVLGIVGAIGVGTLIYFKTKK